MALIPFPFDLPEGFLERLGYHHARRIVGIWWERAGDEVAFTDGVHGLVGADAYVYWELTRRPEVRSWLGEHAINLGNSEQRPTHWLVIDCATGQAHICDAASTRARIRTQILDDWAG